MKRFKSLGIVMVMAIAVLLGIPSMVYAGKSAGTIKNKVEVLMQYKDGSTVPISKAQVGVAGGLLNTKFLLGSEYHTCDSNGKVEFKQTSRITDMYFKLPQAWADKVDSAKAEYRAKLIGTFKYRNYRVESNNIQNNRFRVGMPLAWTTVDMKIYLQAKSFNVTFKNNLGTNTVETVEYLKKATKPTNPTKEGYTFKGWYNGADKFDFENTSITGDIELTAKWEKNKYTVSFNSDNGTAEVKKTVEYGAKVERPTNPTKEGHKFLGWYNGEDEFDFESEIKEDIELTAKWEKNKYTVSFNSDNGTAEVKKTVEYGAKVGKPSNPVKEGYKFLGWFDGENAFNFESEIKEDIELTAKWEKNKYTVTFNSDNGTAEVKKTVEYGAKVEKPGDPVKEGYKFLGWYNGENAFNFESEIKRNIELTAKWEKNKYTVSFNSDNGTEVESKTVEYGAKVERPTNPTKEGHKFLGWYNGADKFDFESEIKGDIELTAKWDKNKYTVSFNSDNGTAEVKKTVEYGAKVEKPSNPVKEGYKFLGWYNGADKFDFESEIKRNIELTAKWEKNKYTVSFNSDNGTEVESKTVEYGAKVERPTNPTKEGHKFLGWYNGENEFDFESEIKEDIELTAKWEKNKYTVTFNSDNGTEVDSQIVEYGEKATRPSNDPIKEGYTFDGWYQNGTPFDFENTPIIEDIELTAQWIENPPQPQGLVINFTFIDGGMWGYSHFLAKGENGEAIDLTNIVTALSVNGVQYTKCDNKQTAIWARDLYCIEGDKLYISSRNEGDILTITDNNGTNHRYRYSNKTLTLIP